MSQLRPLLASILALGAIGLSTFACGDSGATNTGGGTSTGTGASTGTGSNNGVCILHNCNSNDECQGCSDGRTSCSLSDHRCVACGQDGKGCPTGQKCSSFGICVDQNLDCPTNAGTPTITCNASGDCAACDPAHQVCDGATHQCVACTANDTSECQSTDICKNGQCQNKCAPGCLTDNDCGQCTGAKACNNHKCAQCSATYACPSGYQCSANGTCEKICGKPTAPGVCTTNADCSGCGEVGYTCKTPVNGGDGVCIPPAAGCSDLGMGALALPAPWNQYTQTCSTGADCANISIDFNVGKALRDLTGLGTDKIADANISYPMGVCAAVEIASKSCGLCVPCREDADCHDIDIDQLQTNLFPGVSGIVIAVLLDQIFGNQPHKIYMFCQSVTAGYGVCAPCPGLLTDCGVTSGGSMACPSGVNQTPQCCGDVCAADPYCCSTSWDSVCDGEASNMCGGNQCAHDACAAGTKLDTTCGACVSSVCAQDSYCCSTSWDSQCVSEATATASCGC